MPSFSRFSFLFPVTFSVLQLNFLYFSFSISHPSLAVLVDCATEDKEEGVEQKKYCFELTFGTGKSPHMFSALSDADKQDWIKLFRKCVKV